MLLTPFRRAAELCAALFIYTWKFFVPKPISTCSCCPGLPSSQPFFFFNLFPGLSCLATHCCPDGNAPCLFSLLPVDLFTALAQILVSVRVAKLLLLFLSGCAALSGEVRASSSPCAEAVFLQSSCASPWLFAPFLLCFQRRAVLWAQVLCLLSSALSCKGRERGGVSAKLLHFLYEFFMFQGSLALPDP